jgi:hypothetical protein
MVGKMLKLTAVTEKHENSHTGTVPKSSAASVLTLILQNAETAIGYP